MSDPRWQDDDGLDGMLGDLGLPEGAAPRASAADILQRAATLAPPGRGLAGWKLAAVLAVTLAGGVGVGWWMGRGEEVPAVAVEEASPHPAFGPPLPRAGEGEGLADRMGSGKGESSSDSRRSQDPGPTLPLSPDGERVAEGRVRAPADPTPVADIAAPTPEPPTTSPAPIEDLDALPLTEPRARRARRARDANEVATVTRASRALQVKATAGLISLPPAVNGLIVAAGVGRGPQDRSGANWDMRADLGRLNPSTTGHNTAGLDLAAGYTWQAPRVGLALDWTLGGRLVLPPAGGKPPNAPETGPLSHAGPHAFPFTGPRVELLFGEADRPRLSAAFNASLGPGDPGQPPVAGFRVTFGTTFGVGGQQES